MPDIKNWLIHQLGGFPAGQFAALEKELEIVKTSRFEERQELLAEVHELKQELQTLRTATNSEKLPVAKVPMPITPVPWHRLKRDFERRDAQRAHENTETKNGR